MPRYIDADAYKAELIQRQEACIVWQNKSNPGGELYIRAEQAFTTFIEAKLTLDKMPTVDAVPVVRCADCVHCQYDALYGDRWCDGRRVKPDGYCSYGKRKDLSLGTDNSPHVELEPITGEYNRYHGELDVRNGKLTIYGSDRCVCCGAVVPEGRMVCPSCERRASE